MHKEAKGPLEMRKAAMLCLNMYGNASASDGRKRKNHWQLKPGTQDEASTSLQTSDIVRRVPKEKANITVILAFPSKIYMFLQNRIHF